MRDKLIELIDSNKACDFEWDCGECKYYDITPCFGERLADVLIVNGVTFADVPETNVGKWIPVSERLPEESATVFVLCKNGAVFSGYRFNDYENAVRWRIHTALSSTKLLNKGRVTHWMPLPEPPKEGE